MQIDIITLFPEICRAPLTESMMNRAQTKGLVDSGCTAVAYETVTDATGGLPLLAPMSEVAGRMSIQVGAQYLRSYQHAQNTRGVNGNLAFTGQGLVGKGDASPAKLRQWLAECNGTETG